MTVYVKEGANTVLAGLGKMKDAMIADYADFMPPNDDFRKKMNEDYENNFTITYGKKYIKIIECREGHPSSVWGFINVGNKKFQVGDVLKAAGWAAPALNAPRGNILEGYEIGVNHKTHRVFGPDYLV